MNLKYKKARCRQVSFSNATLLACRAFEIYALISSIQLRFQDRINREDTFMLGNPLARTDELVVQKTNNEHLIYDLQTNNAICLNQTSGLVWEHCDGKHTVSDIARQMEKKLGLEISEDLVLFAINQLAGPP